MAVMHILLVEPDPKLRAPLLKMLHGAGHLVSVAADWNDGLARSGEEVDAIVVDYPSDIAASGAAAVLGQFRARRQQPVLVLASSQDCRRLRQRVLAPGIRAIPRMALLEELRALERRPSTDTIRKASTDQFRRQAVQTASRPPSTPLSSTQTATITDGSPLEQFRVVDETIPVGTVLDKYRIDALVGKGGFAHVYRATHLVLGMPVALKVLKRSLALNEPQVVEGFCTEARNAIRISHPNVVRVHDVTKTDKHAYLVMEWLEGVSLSDVLATTGRIPANDALRIGIAVCSGLEAALAHGTIHRDVKPGNILLANDGAVKLVDFGLAKNLRQSALAGVAVDHSRIVGTPSYMSPEQAFAPETIDCRADMYSLGATLYHAIAGRTPYVADDAIQMLMLHRDHPVPDLSEAASDCPDEVAGLVSRMMAKEQAKRFSSYAELRALMQSLLEGMANGGEDATNGWSAMFLRKRTAPAGQ
jgi:serine/threonine protein kinase/CheY-like chemotaxis protein